MERTVSSYARKWLVSEGSTAVRSAHFQRRTSAPKDDATGFSCVLGQTAPILAHREEKHVKRSRGVQGVDQKQEAVVQAKHRQWVESERVEKMRIFRPDLVDLVVAVNLGCLPHPTSSHRPKAVVCSRPYVPFRVHLT